MRARDGPRRSRRGGLSGTTLTLKPLEPVSAAVVKALRADAADVVRFLGLADETEVVVAQA